MSDFGQPASEAEWAAQRARMVREQLATHHLRDPRVLAAMAKVPRHEFVPPEHRIFAYDDGALPLYLGQTVSQAFTVAYMCEAARIEPRDRVLEIGAGSGYGAAVLAELAAEVHTIERLEALAELARDNLDRTGYSRVQVHVGDGTLGWSAAAPYDAIIVTAGGPRIPETLRSQLADGGRLVMPIGETPREQTLVRVTRHGATWSENRLGAFRFVPLVGEEGWDE